MSHPHTQCTYSYTQAYKLSTAHCTDTVNHHTECKSTNSWQTCTSLHRRSQKAQTVCTCTAGSDRREHNLHPFWPALGERRTASEGLYGHAKSRREIKNHRKAREESSIAWTTLGWRKRARGENETERWVKDETWKDEWTNLIDRRPFIQQMVLVYYY